jgi:hypothetical protein
MIPGDKHAYWKIALRDIFLKGLPFSLRVVAAQGEMGSGVRPLDILELHA